MGLSQNKKRENIISSIYDNNIYQKAKIDFDLNQTLLNNFEVENLSEIDTFSKEIYLLAYKNYDEIVNLVQSKLVKWKFSRLNDLAQALFLEAVSEVNYAKLTEKAIVINFAVDYAKKYLSSQDYKYINAVLDRILIK